MKTSEPFWNATLPYFQFFRFSAEESLTWNVAESELPYIPEHWFNFPVPHPLVNYSLGFLYFIFFVVSCAGNGIVIWIFSTCLTFYVTVLLSTEKTDKTKASENFLNLLQTLRNPDEITILCTRQKSSYFKKAVKKNSLIEADLSKSLQTPSNVFVINLAIFDFIMMVKTPIMIYNSMNLGFASGHVWCQIFGVLGTISGIGASATNACIAFDRCETITNPLQKNMGKGKAIFICTLVWIYTLPWAILPALEIWGRFVPEGFLTTCTFDYLTDTIYIKTFVATLFTFSYVLPVSLIIFFYTKIVIHVVRHEKTLKDQAKKMNVESLRSNAQKNEAAEIRITKAAVTMCFLFIFSWTPYGIVALIGCFGNKDLITPIVSMIPACTCKAVACIDPYIYAISHPRFRIELKKRFSCLTGCINEPRGIDELGSQITEQAGTI